MEIRIHGYEEKVGRQKPEIREAITEAMKGERSIMVVVVSFLPKMDRVLMPQGVDIGDFVEAFPLPHEEFDSSSVNTKIAKVLGLEELEVVFSPAVIAYVGGRRLQ